MVRRVAPVLLVLAGSAMLGACVDEEVVFDDRPIYQRVAAIAGGFVGYADPSSDDKLTVCGQCHSDLQAQWEGTAHADAWDGLQSSGHAQEFCEACHTVNSFGNVALEGETGGAQGGHAAVATEDGRYLDVQCESCHGPGLTHVLDPGVANRPLAPIETGTDLSFGCGECHSGTHHPFVEEWSRSAHGNPNFAAAEEADGCYLCHSGEGGLMTLGVTADYLEKDELVGSGEDFAAITCAVCHDPHGSENEAQLRKPVTTTNTGEHLCAACHDRQANPDTQGAQDYLQTHAPAAGLQAGTAGWFPPGSGVTPPVSHAHTTQAEKLCATCHVVGYTSTDPATEQDFFSVGHRFLAIPCVDPATGLPTEEQGCGLSAAERSYRGCVGCHHADEADAAAALQAAVSELLPQVRALFDRLREVDPNLNAPGGAIDASDPTFTTAEGAYFNLTVALSAGGLPNQDAAARRFLAAALIHNPTLVRQLVTESKAALDAEYPALMAGAAVVGPAGSER